MKITTLLLAIALTATAAQAADEPKPIESQPEDLKMYAGKKVYVAPMDGYENYFIAAMLKKKVALAITTKPEDADYQVSGSAESQKAGWAKMLFARSAQSSEEISVVITNIKTGSVLWSCSANKANAIRGKRSAAEACAKGINKFLYAGATTID